MKTARIAVGIVFCTVVSNCGTPSEPPAAPSRVHAPDVAGPFSVTGMVREHRGGPLSGVLITARPNVPPGNGMTTVRTDAAGFYRIDGLTEPIIVDAERVGYFPTGFGAFVGDRVVNLTMTRRVDMNANETLTATIWGDSVLSSEDDTGSNCDEHDSRGVHSSGCLLIPVRTGGAGTLTARLSWDGPGTEMGVFVTTGFSAGRGAHGWSPLTVSVDVGYETMIVVSLERVNGVRPVPASASQVFDLTTSFVPR